MTTFDGFWTRRRKNELRATRRVAAGMAGFYWLDCPRCREPFAADEAADVLTEPSDLPNQRSSVCRWCEDDVTRRRSWLCGLLGHKDLVRIWHMTNVSTEVDGLRTTKTGSFDLNAAPDIVRCSRCLKRLQEDHAS